MQVDCSRQPFVVLIGGRGWAAELTAAEAGALRRAVQRLQQQLQATAPLLMAEESLELEYDSGGLWMQLSGLGNAWALRFVLTSANDGAGPPARGLEGSWEVGAAAAFAAALEAAVLPQR